jgi:hypothetical protein
MEVVDEHGQRLGTVDRVRLGYPEAVTPDDGSGVFKGVGLVVAPMSGRWCHFCAPESSRATRVCTSGTRSTRIKKKVHIGQAKCSASC